MFISKDSYVGRKVKLNHDINTTNGTFTKGSVMTVVTYSKISRIFDLQDDDSGEKLYCSRSNGNTDTFNFID